MAALGLRLPEARYYVTKTGLPFFDAARLWGACHLLFGTAVAVVRDEGSHWTLEGYRLERRAPHITWVRERLDRSGLQNISTALNKLQVLERPKAYAALAEYFALPPDRRDSRRWDEDSVGRYLEPALLQGSRGPESFRYGSLASTKGTDVKLPQPEVVAAALGICLAALGSSGDPRRNPDRLLILPVPAADQRPVPIGPFLRFHHEVRHRAGGIAGPIALALHVLEQIADRLPIRDFAYARHGGRGFYESGYLGLHGVLRRWYDDPPGGPVRTALLDAAAALRLTRDEQDGDAQALARAVAAFVHSPSLVRLEAVVRLRWRVGAAAAQAGGRGWARGQATRALWFDDASVEGVIRLVSAGEQGRDDVQQRATVLARNVAAALRAISGDSDRAWIGWYMRLENAPDAPRFFREIERLKARARMAVLSQGGKESDWFSVWPDDAGWLALEVGRRSERDPRYFRLFRAAFLLEVQNHRQRQLWRAAQRAEQAGQPAAEEEAAS